MRNSTVLVCAGLFALAAPIAAEAKSYTGDNARSHHRSLSRSHRASEEGSTSRSCLTRDARALLNRIESRFGPVEIVSTGRPGARIATSGRPSKHASGEAIDFRVPGRKRDVVKWLIQNHSDGGTMTYSDMDHIHVDVGYHFVALNRPSGN
jgi:uncharacterized protein YcbK (DUF882 family)